MEPNAAPPDPPYVSKHGCWNRQPLKNKLVVQDGYEAPVNQNWGKFSREAIYIEIEDDMSKPCQFTLSKKNNPSPDCVGCKWKSDNPIYDY